MLSLNQIAFLRSLSSKKHRQKYHKYVAEGEKLVREALRDCPDLVIEVIARSDRFTPTQFDNPFGVKWVEASGKDMDRISNLSTPPGIMAVLAMPDQAKLPPVNNHHRHLFLDNVSDPGNVGGILRTADWFGIKSVILGPGTAEWTNPKVVQASMGSIFRLRMQYASFEEAVQALRDVPWMAADMDGRDTVSFVWPSQGVLVLGSESHGLSPDIRSRVASLVTIPKSATGGAESLNVGVATGILLNAWTRSGLQ